MKLKKILAATLVGAMVLTNVPVGNHGTAVAVAAENQEETNNVNVVENLQAIDLAILAKNAKANSQQTNPPGKGGVAAWAFDNEEHWWHSRFQGNVGDGEVQSGLVSENNPIWIQTGFDDQKMIKKVIYQSRTDDQGGIINEYELQVATVDNPTDNDFRRVAGGNFSNSQSEQAIILGESVPAKYIRLVAKSVHPKADHRSYVTAKKIRVYEEVVTPVESIKLNKDNLELKIGQTEILQATVTPEGATFKDVTWNSLNSDVATVDDTGLVTAKSAGNATIEVYSTRYPNIKASCTVVVTRDDTELDKAIAEANAKKGEADFEVKYTEKSRLAFEEALKMAEEAKGDSTETPENVKLVVENLKAAIAGLEMKAVVTINNNGKEEIKYCEIGEQVKVVAAQAPDGQKFSHWAVDGKAICYKESYTFTVYKNTEVAAVYIEADQPVEKTVNVLCNISYENGKVKFVSKHSVPADAGYTVLKAGVVATDQRGYTAIENAKQELSLETTATKRLKKYGMNTSYYLFNFTQYLQTSQANTWYARGYVTYQDSEGVTHTVYSDVQSIVVG